MAADLTPSVPLRVNVLEITIFPSGDAVIQYQFVDDATSADRGHGATSAPQNGPAVDQAGRQVAASTPGAFKTAASAMVAQVQSLLNAALAGGKIVWP